MCKVVITIPSLVWLRRTLRRWRSRASDDDDAAAVPAGHVAVSVQGAAPRRFVVRVAHLSHPAFLELLRLAEEEYGFPAAPGPITLPCDEDRFLDVLHRVSSSSCCCGPLAARRGRGDTRPLLRGMAVEKLVW
ncbi:auxin-responsive protein SAUR21-like [Miscanthus floridulus]|uniref:auxin-responsive protein SAUR21-like n=1 Tax=Miscanthus floridulus TaxID=154761 RepID=UPI00345AADA1